MTKAELARRLLYSAERHKDLADDLYAAVAIIDFDSWLKFAKGFPADDPRSCTCRPTEGPYHGDGCPRRGFWDHRLLTG